MDQEVFAEFLLRQGYKVFQTKSCYWYNAQPGFYFYFPYHKLIEPTNDELKSLMWGRPFIGARYFTQVQVGGRESYLLVCEDKNYDLDSVNAKYARRQTRRGLEHFKIDQIGFEELANFGLPLVHDTLLRQGRDLKSWTEKGWRDYCLAAKGLSGFEAWGAFTEGKLAAFMIGFLMEDHFTILHHSSSTEWLPLYSNNALVYSVTKLKLALPEISCVYYGPESLDAPKSLDKFKFRMGFVTKPMRQKIIFHPLLKPAFNRFSQKLVHLLAVKNPGSDLWQKVDGIFGFYTDTDPNKNVSIDLQNSLGTPEED